MHPPRTNVLNIPSMKTKYYSLVIITLRTFVSYLKRHFPFAMRFSFLRDCSKKNYKIGELSQKLKINGIVRFPRKTGQQIRLQVAPPE